MRREETAREIKLEYLRSYRWLDAEIDDDERRLAAIDDRLYGISAQRITDMPRGGQPVTVDALIADKTELQELIREKCVRRMEILRRIESMPSERDRRILKLRFVDGLTYEQTAERINYSVMSVQRFINTAIEHFPEIE